MLAEGHEKLVHIYSLVSDAEAGKFPPGFSDDLEERLAYFSKLAVANPEVRKSLGVCYDAVTRNTEERVGTGILF
jgi:hypothetical protein